MVNRESYVPHRRLLYGLLWAVSVAELGLTDYRINFTRRNFRTHDRIVAALLTTSILTIIWLPLTFLFHRSANNSAGTAAGGTTSARRGGGSRLGPLYGEMFGNFILWVMWLVGAAIATNRWPTRALAGPGKQGRILITIVALAWVAFGLLTLAKMFTAMEYAARNAVGYDGAPGYNNGAGYGRGKGARVGEPAAGTAPGVSGAGVGPGATV